MERFKGGCSKAADGEDGDGKDTNAQGLNGYGQLYACKADGSIKYLDVNTIDWFHTRGARGGVLEQLWYGGVPLGMLIADDIFSTGMKFVGSLKDLSADHTVARTAADA